MADLFKEIKEDIRQEQLLKFWQNYKQYILVGAVGILAVVTVALYWQHSQNETRVRIAQSYAKAVSLGQEGKAQQAYDELSELRLSNYEGYSLLAGFTSAALAQDDNRDAGKIYQSMINNYKIDATYRDLALLLSALCKLDNNWPDHLNVSLERLFNSASQWRAFALEILAARADKVGEKEKAKILYRQLSQDASATEGARMRALALASQIK